MNAWRFAAHSFAPLIASLLALALAACAPVRVAGLPDTAALRAPLSRQDQIEANWKESSGSLLMTTEVESGRLQLLATTLLGQPLFELHYDGMKVAEVQRAAEIPKRLPLAYLLRDLLWATFPAERLRPALTAAKMQLQEEGGRRQILQDGKPLLEITQEGDHLHVENPRFGYVLDITPVETGGGE